MSDEEQIDYQLQNLEETINLENMSEIEKNITQWLQNKNIQLFAPSEIRYQYFNQKKQKIYETIKNNSTFPQISLDSPIKRPSLYQKRKFKTQLVVQTGLPLNEK